MIETESFCSEAHFSTKSETELENENERDCGIALWWSRVTMPAPNLELTTTNGEQHWATCLFAKKKTSSPPQPQDLLRTNNASAYLDRIFLVGLIPFVTKCAG